MRRQNVLRMGLFIIFFSVGAATLGGALVCDELLRYYHNRQLLAAAEESLNRLKSLNADYDALLKRLHHNPELLERIAPATFGTQPADANAVYPKATAEWLAAAREALAEDTGDKAGRSVVPDWIVRCSRPLQRAVLFLAGAFLILISFIWFGPAGKPAG